MTETIATWKTPPSLPRFETSPHVWTCPQVGIIFEGHESERFARGWYGSDPLNWSMPEFIRDAWLAKIVRRWDDYLPRLRGDYTSRLHAHIDSVKALGGGLIMVSGWKGSGKSILAQMLIMRVQSAPPFVVFSSTNTAEVLAGREDMELGLIVDESLTKTGELSANEIIHDRNVWETNRKAKLWGVRVGVNVDPEKWGQAVDLAVQPCGFNLDFQATRFAMYMAGTFVGFAALQRWHLPTDLVYYGNQAGTWTEYEQRARQYSETVARNVGAQGAVDVALLRRSYTTFTDYILKQVDEGVWADVPDRVSLETDYLESEFPALSVADMKRVIARAVRDAKNGLRYQKRDSIPPPMPQLTDKGWDILRQELACFGEDFALYAVPRLPKDDYAAVKQELGLSIQADSLGQKLRRRQKDIPPKALGDAGEHFVLALLDSLQPTAGGGGADVPDVLLTRPDGREHALAVKLTLREEYRENESTTPEHHWLPHAHAVLVMPRLLQVRLYPVTGEYTTLNANGGHLATPDTLLAVVREVLTQ